MRTIGNIERFLVGGIVIVIGVILFVAIRGANDVHGEYDKRVAEAKTSQAGKNGPAIKRDSTMPRAPQQPVDHGVVSPPASPVNSPIDAKSGGAPNVAPNSGAPVVGGGNGGTNGGNAGGAAAPIDPAIKRAMDERNAALQGLPVAGGDKKNDRPPTDLTGGARKSESSEPLDAPRPVIDTPAPPPAPAPLLTKEYWYEVQKGDTLERIARALYSDGALWKEIHDANPSLTDAHAIRVGQKLKLPKEPSSASAFVTTKDASATASESHVAATPPAPDHTASGGALDAKSAKSEPKNESRSASGFKRVTAVDQYKVQKGDTLMSIALANYGTKGAWKLILDANGDAIADKDRLKVGTTLKLPLD